MDRLGNPLTLHPYSSGGRPSTHLSPCIYPCMFVMAGDPDFSFGVCLRQGWGTGNPVLANRASIW